MSATFGTRSRARSLDLPSPHATSNQVARAWRVRVRTRNAWRRPHSPEAPCRCASQSDMRFKRAPTFRLTTRSAQPHPFGSDGPARQSIANRYHVRLDTNRSDMPAKTSLTLDDSDARGHLAPNLAESVRQSLRAECSNPSANSSSFGITLTILSTSDAKLLANQLERRRAGTLETQPVRENAVRRGLRT